MPCTRVEAVHISFVYGAMWRSYLLFHRMIWNCLVFLEVSSQLGVGVIVRIFPAVEGREIPQQFPGRLFFLLADGNYFCVFEILWTASFGQIFKVSCCSWCWICKLLLEFHLIYRLCLSSWWLPWLHQV